MTLTDDEIRSLPERSGQLHWGALRELCEEVLRLRAELAAAKHVGNQANRYHEELGKCRAMLQEQDHAANKAVLCHGCGGTLGDHFSTDQGGCPGDFRIDGVSVFPVANRDAEIARLRAENDRLMRLVDTYKSWVWMDDAIKAGTIPPIPHSEDDSA
jgi:uncharacterized small protein (DUF1192 family)